MEKQKRLKLLYLLKILWEETDEEHSLTGPQLAEKLEQEGISIERRSIYNDVDALNDFGFDIIHDSGRVPGYHMGSRDFEMAELKLLVDAVQVAKFITPKKTGELIAKISSLASVHEAAQLRQQVSMYQRNKAENETIFYNVDMLYTALYRGCRIRFQYAEWNLKKEFELRHGGAFYEVSPWALTWDNENYYLIAFHEKYNQIRHYRVDKMKSMSILAETRNGEASFRNFNLAAYTKKTFGMFSGYDETVTLHCSNDLIGVVIDRFGKEIMIIPKGPSHFDCIVPVNVSQQFFGWVTAIGPGMQIAGPEQVRQEYRDYIRSIVEGIDKTEAQ